jgi:hypothetical protein
MKRCVCRFRPRIGREVRYDPDEPVRRTKVRCPGHATQAARSASGGRGIEADRRRKEADPDLARSAGAARVRPVEPLRWALPPRHAPLPRRPPCEGGELIQEQFRSERMGPMRSFQNNHAQRRDHYQELTDRIIAALEAGTAPWRRPWNPPS